MNINDHCNDDCGVGWLLSSSLLTCNKKVRLRVVNWQLQACSESQRSSVAAFYLNWGNRGLQCSDVQHYHLTLCFPTKGGSFHPSPYSMAALKEMCLWSLQGRLWWNPGPGSALRLTELQKRPHSFLRSPMSNSWPWQGCWDLGWVHGLNDIENLELLNSPKPS